MFIIVFIRVIINLIKKSFMIIIIIIMLNIYTILINKIIFILTIKLK